jgi:O-antigen ligase
MDRHALDLMSALVFLVVGAATAYLAYRRPSWAIGVFILIDPFAWYHDVGRTTITFPKVVLAAIIVGLLARRTSIRPLFCKESRALSIAALALIAANALSIVPAVYADVVARETFKAIEYALAFAVCVVAVADDPDPRPVRVALIGAVTLVAMTALVQEFLGTPSSTSIAGHAVPRLAGVLEGPNQLAGYLGLAIPVLLAYAAILRDRLCAAVSAIAFLVLILTLSRAGIAATLLAIALLAVVGRGFNVRIALAAAGGALGAGAAALAAIGGLNRFMSFSEIGAPTGLATRSQLWTAAIDLWKRSPWLGIGAGNYELELPTVGLLGVRTHANSLYLQALVEGGVPLLAATLWSVYASIATFAAARGRDPLVLGVLAACFGLAIHQVFDCLTFYPKVGEFWWILMGIAVGRMTSGQIIDAGKNDAE